MPRRHLRVSESDRVQGAGAEVLDHDVSVRKQMVEGSATFRVLEVERDALFVPIDAQVVRALPLDEWRSPAPRVVAARRMLDLDDACAQVGSEHGAEGAGQHAREIENRQASERRLAHGDLIGEGDPRLARVATVTRSLTSA